MELDLDSEYENVIVPEHEAKDRILKFLVDSIPREDIIADEIHENTFPDQPKVFTYQLLLHIKNANENLILHKGKDWSLTYFTVWFTATELTRQFLENGGFTKLHYEKLQDERDAIVRKRLEEEALMDTIKTNRSTRWNYRINTAISIAALIISILALIKGCQE